MRPGPDTLWRVSIDGHSVGNRWVVPAGEHELAAPDAYAARERATREALNAAGAPISHVVLRNSLQYVRAIKAER